MRIFQNYNERHNSNKKRNTMYEKRCKQGCEDGKKSTRIFFENERGKNMEKKRFSNAKSGWHFNYDASVRESMTMATMESNSVCEKFKGVRI